MPHELFSFRYRHPLTGRWVLARYKASREEIAARYPAGEWEIAGPPEIRGDPIVGYFNPLRAAPAPVTPSAELDPTLSDLERDLARVFLRRYVTWCARRRRWAQMEGAALLLRQIAA